jgi:hypothetical protein
MTKNAEYWGKSFKKQLFELLLTLNFQGFIDINVNFSEETNSKLNFLL